MIGQSTTGQRRHWIQAIALSVGLHGAAVAGLIHDPALRLPSRDSPEPAVLSIEALSPQGVEAGAGDDLRADDAAPSDALPDLPQTEAATAPLSDMEPALQRPVQHPVTGTMAQGLRDDASSPIITGAGDWAVVAQRMPQLPANPLAPLPDPEPVALPDLPQSSTGADGSPLDPRLAALITGIRDSLDQPCLVALPGIGTADQLQLTVLADDDRRIAGFTADLADKLAEPLPERRILLDSRQCPGLTFARRAPDYPLFGLGLQLQSGEIDSGASLVGRIANGAGHFNTLLLVDDNGVVQDLRRFLIVQGGEVSFDVPMARVGASRDTSQLLIAIATPQPLESVTAQAGRLAQDFFPTLLNEIEGDVLIGLSSVHIR